MLLQKEEFINFVIDCGVLKFGNFITKSGRKTPYFINTGNFKTGQQLSKLGLFYANLIKNSNLKFNALFGPAYKGIPLVVCCCNALFEKFEIDMPFFFNRKEEKDHGEKGFYVGYNPNENDTIAIIEDVLTAGTALNEVVPKLQKNFKINIKDMFIAVNRCEKAKNSNYSATKMIKQKFDINIHEIINIYDIRNYLKNNKFKYAENLKSVDDYISKYCENY